jgi:hypothetical protein
MVYRENADDIVLWPKHGLPIQPGPGEDEVILGQVVMTDFAHAQVLDRLLVHERRIENSLYRTMAQLRREREARTAASEGVSHSETGLAAGEESAAPARLGSFDLGATPKRSLSVSSRVRERAEAGTLRTSLSVAPTRSSPAKDRLLDHLLHDNRRIPITSLAISSYVAITRTGDSRTAQRTKEVHRRHPAGYDTDHT